MTSTSTFVLVPGAGHGGWQWTPVAHRLRAAGHTAITLTLPGFADGDERAALRLSDAVEHTVQAVLDRELTDVTFVAHSWGGYPVTAATHRLAGQVSKVIFYSALVPARGVPLVDENPDYATMIRDAIAASPDGTVDVSRELAGLLAPDAPQATRDLLFDLLEPTPGAYYTDALDLPDLTSLDVDLAYLLAENDQVLARPGAEFATRLGLSPVIVPGPHDGMLTHPDEVTQAILLS
ncbi:MULTISPECIES: alpha/beta fold hydrolase [Actinoalloteichus]|uniref:Hydrolase or acyltransferase of alpha/beta superfamily n=1 Tax=Actinoalloteichus fjordicus TaxID=1612552 RepID=A0AAC9LA34_9PSEU|nr:MULTISPECIES: alpha/beta hydrolase [Actinoalloteichus]APU13134.1 putative hydrolase or acyltransferase of alpha/beta superfamily [Actinoalloteichus fjordicus]APU19085.1 putative hydrolase or acyltransferase of alpha/beta superfamily [Actinoalloteichus sp. GBA129-24]